MGSFPAKNMSMDESAQKFAAGFVANVNAGGDEAKAKVAGAMAMSPEDAHAAGVARFNANSTDGKMDLDQFKAFIAATFEGLPTPPADSIPEEKWEMMFGAIDTDGDGALDEAECGAFMKAAMTHIIAGFS